MMPRRRTVLLALGTVVVGLAGWFGGPLLFRRLDFFQIRRVELVGVTLSTPAKLVAALQIPPGANLFDDLGPYQERARAAVGIRTAKVRRRLPGTLVMEVTEAQGVALAPRDGQLAMVGRNGKFLPFNPAVSAPDLPVVDQPDAAVAGVLGRLQEMDPELFSRIETASRVNGDVVVDFGGRRLWLRPDVTVEVIRAVMAAEQVLGREGRAWAELDGRYAGQVVVRGRGRAG